MDPLYVRGFRDPATPSVSTFNASDCGGMSDVHSSHLCRPYYIWTNLVSMISFDLLIMPIAQSPKLIRVLLSWPTSFFFCIVLYMGAPTAQLMRAHAMLCSFGFLWLGSLRNPWLRTPRSDPFGRRHWFTQAPQSSLFYAPAIWVGNGPLRGPFHCSG